MEEDKPAIGSTNAAERISEIAEQALQRSQARGSTDVWADVFGVPKIENQLEVQRLVSDFLSAVGVELQAIATALAAENIPEKLHRNALARLHNAFSVGALNVKWDDHAGRFLDAETRMALRWIAFTLPKEAMHYDLEEVSSILALLDDLEAQLSSDGIPPGLRAMLSKHASAMRAAIKLVPVQGPAGLRKAVRAVLADVHLDEDEIRTAVNQGNPEEVRSVLSRFGAAFKKTAQAAGDLEKLSKGAGIVFEVLEAGRQLLELPGA